MNFGHPLFDCAINLHVVHDTASYTVSQIFIGQTVQEMFTNSFYIGTQLHHLFMMSYKRAHFLGPNFNVLLCQEGLFRKSSNGVYL